MRWHTIHPHLPLWSGGYLYFCFFYGSGSGLLGLSSDTRDRLTERKQDKCPLETLLDFEEDVFDDEVQRKEAIPLFDEEIALYVNASSEGTMSPGGPRVSMSSPIGSICSGGGNTAAGGGDGNGGSGSDDGDTDDGSDGKGDLGLLRDDHGKSGDDGKDDDGMSDGGKDDDGNSDGSNGYQVDNGATLHRSMAAL
nr:hypothetical protein [Tanacetum cinerariifolium]